MKNLLFILTERGSVTNNFLAENFSDPYSLRSQAHIIPSLESPRNVPQGTLLSPAQENSTLKGAIFNGRREGDSNPRYTFAYTTFPR